MRNLVIILLLSLLWSCTKDDFEIELPFEGDGTQIDIYLIKNGIIETFNQLEEVGMEDLEETPWLAHDQIEFYDWSSHSFYLKDEQVSSKGSNYFVLTADGEPLFAGFFYSMLMSSFPPVPIIISDFSFGAPKDVITFNRFGFIDTEGIMSKDSEFRKEMGNSGLLKEGIEVDLLALERKNSTTLKYTYKVTNMDIENIYILDSDKMGTSRFHAFTNGVYFKKGDKYFNATNFDATLSD